MEDVFHCFKMLPLFSVDNNDSCFFFNPFSVTANDQNAKKISVEENVLMQVAHKSGCSSNLCNSFCARRVKCRLA